MLPRILLLDLWLDSTLVHWLIIVTPAVAGGAWQSRVITNKNTWTARFPKIGPGRDTYEKEQLEDFSTRAGKCQELPKKITKGQIAR
jgi:hypothetical protein